MNPYLVAVLIILIGQWMIESLALGLNLRKLSPNIPRPFRDVMDEERYAQSQRYLKTRSIFHLLSSTISLVIQLGIILGGGFNFLDQRVREWGLPALGRGLCYGLILWLAYRVALIPYDMYETFVIEERFGFNKATRRTFWTDWLKGSALGCVVGGGLWFIVLYLFEKMGLIAWFPCWLATVAYQLLMMYIAPVLLLPLFYKLKPLACGELKTAIENYARKEKFHASGIFVMDGSTRSTRTNAFFTGFGRFRRIVFFDTLILAHPKEEITAVLAHEMGHFRFKHVVKMMANTFVLSGILFWGLTYFVHHPGLFSAFQMDHVSTYAGIIFYGYLSSPLVILTSILENKLSRIYEFQADRYAAMTFSPEAMMSSLKRIAKDNLVNLFPHPFKVWLMDSHPPIIERLKYIEAIRADRSSIAHHSVINK